MPTFAELLAQSAETNKERQKEIAASPIAQKAKEHMLPPEQTLNVKPAETPEGEYHNAVADYVTENNDEQPTQEKFGIRLPIAAPAREVTLDRLLHGTGITKKIAEKTDKVIAKVSETETKLDNAPSQAITLNLEKVESLAVGDEIKWDEYQLAALEGLEKQKYGCLIGAAGTGKTTVTKELVNRLHNHVPLVDINKAKLDSDFVGEKPREMNVAICFCAFTGRAVQQMKRALPMKYHNLCNTVHKTLGYMPEKEEYEDEETGEIKEKIVFRPTFTKYNKLPYKICIIDESGMLPINLWNELFDALPSDCRIILIGDINQLPPVQGRSVLGFAMINWPTFTLKHIHRQAADNPIIANAHKILRGTIPLVDRKKFIVKTLDGGSTQAYQQVLGVVKHLHQKKIFDPFRDALIVPKNVGTLGQEHLNEHLVGYFNPEQTTADGIVTNQRIVITASYTHVAFAVGDKVMLLQNDNQKQLTNGMTGVVTEIVPNGNFKDKGNAYLDPAKFEMADDANLDFSDLNSQMTGISVAPKEEDEKESQRAASHITTVKFGAVDGEREVSFSTAGQYRKIKHAYAFTCHKSQGGEYPTVIIVLHSADLRMLNREWLYTAVTRAQERVILLCNNRGLVHAINSQTIKGKTVKEKAQAFLALQGKEDTSLPNLPQPMEI